MGRAHSHGTPVQRSNAVVLSSLLDDFGAPVLGLTILLLVMGNIGSPGWLTNIYLAILIALLALDASHQGWTSAYPAVVEAQNRPIAFLVMLTRLCGRGFLIALLIATAAMDVTPDTLKQVRCAQAPCPKFDESSFVSPIVGIGIGVYALAGIAMLAIRAMRENSEVRDRLREFLVAALLVSVITGAIATPIAIALTEVAPAFKQLLDKLKIEQR